ncbi:phosphoribosyl-ATP diphosphatase [Lichenicola cladoniae]|nr:phosphoribosyl-ATP diphosphatase [Lichenicola cladoniae]
MTKPPKRDAKAPKNTVPGKKTAIGGKALAVEKSAIPRVEGRRVVSKKLAKTAAFDMSGATADVLDRLFEVVTSRRNADPNISHSARLLSRGTAKVAQKFGEEAVECLIEAVMGNSSKLIGESADVLYHLIVLWVDAGVNPGEVWSELQRREGTSGIAEKAARPGPIANRSGG